MNMYLKSAMLLGLLVFLSACGKKSTETPEISYPLETAKLVSHVTSGVISPDGNILVQFTTPVIKENLAGQNVKQPVFTFSPSIDGITRWINRQTLEFKPNGALPLRQKYTGKLEIAKLLPETKDKSPKPLEFQFETAGREVANVSTDFRLKNENDPLKIMVTGVVQFTEKTDRKVLEKAATLRKDGQSLRMDWSGDASGKIFTFTSEVIERGKKTVHFTLEFDKDLLEISSVFHKEFALSPLSDLNFVKLTSQDDDGSPALVIAFSDPVSDRSDLTGLISVSPAVKFKTKIIGRRVYLSGKFKNGETYSVTIHPGIRSRFGTELKKQLEKKITLAELKPQLKFASDGIFLPSANERKVRFMSLNLRQVRIEIKKVFENNLGQFLQTEKLNSSQTRNADFNSSYVNRVGIEVFRDSLFIGDTRNEWLQNELDLSRLIDAKDRGLYIIHLNFLRRDMLYGDPDSLKEEQQRYYYGRDYYSNPYSDGYIYNHGNIYKPIIVSDIGLTYKKTHNRHIIFATNIINAKPFSGVRITWKTYQNQDVGSAMTDGEGIAEIPADDQNAFFVEAEKDGQRSVIKVNETAWNLSTFDTDGADAAPEGTHAYIYTERGVYRPGDEANISVIVRNEDGTFPDNHPVTMKIYNPRNQKAYDQTQRTAQDGFYRFTYRGGMDDPTGNYRVEVLAGSRSFFHTLKIETVVPFRLKVNLETQQDRITRTAQTLHANLKSTYLFGNPAAGLQAEVTAIIRSRYLSFSKYQRFIFAQSNVQFRPVESMIFSGKLNSAGEAPIDWKLPSTQNAPSALSLQLNARVYEKGGRPNFSSLTIPVDPYDRYVGLQPPIFDYGYARVGNRVTIPVILVDLNGTGVPGQTLTYRIYKNRRHWWWEFDSRDEFQLRFKSHENTELMKEGTLISQAIPTNINFIPDASGSYFIEVQDGESGHSSSFFMTASAWGSGGSGGADARVLAMKTDKKRYFIGETATISFPVPQQGSILFTIEKGQKMLQSRWIDPSQTDGPEMKIPLEITPEMTPTAYVSVSIIQPHSQTANDRPIRMYGVVPLNVEDPDTRQKITIKMPDELRSNQKFTVEVQTVDHRQSQFTIAVVDEGLLALTDFSTPDAWQHFFQKQRLGVQTFDLFSQVIGAHKGDLFRVFSIGGGVAESYRKSQLDQGKKKRFKPVSMFKGPMMTDKNGNARVEFEMPNYVGAVRVMVISANGHRYGNAEKTVPVKTELMVLATLPRVIGPDDMFVIPATVFAMKENLGNVTVSVDLKGPLKLINDPSQTLSFSETGDKDVFFQVKAEAAVGQAKIVIAAKSANYISTSETDIEVRASSARIYDSETKVVEPGQPITFNVSGRGISGTNHASISISRRPNLNIAHRLRYLIRFPYGCIEQTVSAAFPQLYLKDFLRGEPAYRGKSATEREKLIDKNINAAIVKLRHFQVASGGFSYWPGRRHISEWGSNYAGFFLIEAKKLGYNVPDDLYNNWLNYQQSIANSTRPNLMIRVNRAYLLALSGKPDLGLLNLLKENSLKDMTDTEKWMLAAAYQNAGQANTARQLTKTAGLSVRDYWEFGGTYGSTLRDKAILLEIQTQFGNWLQADELANEIAEMLSTKSWYSTQTTGYMLLALGKYLKALEDKQPDQPRLAGKIRIGNREILFDTDERIFETEISDGFDQSVVIELSDKTTTKRVFTTLSWDGVPLKSNVQDEQKNLSLQVEWLNDDGMRIDPANIKQGTTFWGHFKVNAANSDKRFRHIEEVALVQVLPAGWEIENTRLTGQDLPQWMRNYQLNREEYLDIRDDRIMWFFDLHPSYQRRRGQRQQVSNALDFVVKLNAVTVGEFTLPATLTEAMYNNKFKAVKAGRQVTITR